MYKIFAVKTNQAVINGIIPIITMNFEDLIKDEHVLLGKTTIFMDYTSFEDVKKQLDFEQRRHKSKHDEFQLFKEISEEFNEEKFEYLIIFCWGESFATKNKRSRWIV